MWVFDEGWNIRELWKKGEGKRLNSTIPGQNRSLVPVPNRGGTGTTLQNRFGTGTKQSGTGTTSSCNPSFWYLCIVKL